MASTAGYSKRHYKRRIKQIEDRLTAVPKEENMELDGPNNNEQQPLLPAKSSIDTMVNFSSDPRMIAEFQDLKKSVKAMKSVIEAQTAVISEQSFKINAIYEKLFGPPKAFDVYDFPIKSLKELEELDRKIKFQPEFESDLKIFLSSKIQGKVCKSFSLLISDDFLPEINWNGRKKRVAIKNFKFFISTLYDSVQNAYNSYEEYENDLRDAIKKGKNRMDQRKHQLRRFENQM